MIVDLGHLTNRHTHRQGVQSNQKMKQKSSTRLLDRLVDDLCFITCLFLLDDRAIVWMISVSFFDSIEPPICVCVGWVRCPRSTIICKASRMDWISKT